MILRNSSNKPIQIDKYKILSQLGHGGFGTVYHVLDSKREYALKLLKSTYNIFRIKKHLEVLEILNTSELFLKTYQTKKVLDKFFILMEYSKDGNIKKLAQKQTFTEQTTLIFLNNLLDSIEFLHKNKIIHGDIKAENIVKKGDEYYLIDYDVVKAGPICKTLHIQSDDDFTASEVYRGFRTYSSDIYSLGCTLYYILSSKHIYEFDDDYKFSQKMFSHLYLTPIANENISNKMMYLINRMTHKDYKNRANIQEIREILQEDREYNLPGESMVNIQEYCTEYERYIFMANDGISYAQNILALMYEDGIDVKQDMKQALYWYKQSAKQGLAKAQFNLAMCYKNAKGCETNYDKARELFIDGAKQSHSRSFYNLGDIYENGLGVQKDFEKAYSYYEKASLNGYRPAYKKLKLFQK